MLNVDMMVLLGYRMRLIVDMMVLLGYRMRLIGDEQKMEQQMLMPNLDKRKLSLVRHWRKRYERLLALVF